MVKFPWNLFGVLAVMALMLAGPAWGQDPADEQDADFPDLVDADERGGIMDEFAFLEDAGMVESAARHRQDIGMSPSAITVITRKEIEASGASTFPDLMRLVPGMDVVLMTPAYNAISTRVGWTANNTFLLVRIDGRDAATEWLGINIFGFQPVILEDVERIEIIRGPGSSLYGANAFAGVVNITTRSIPQANSGWTQLSMGEAGSLDLAARASVWSGEWGVSLSGSVDRMGSYNDHRLPGAEYARLRAVAEYRWSSTRRLLIDGAISSGVGMGSTSSGKLQIDAAYRSAQLTYESDDFHAQLYWSGMAGKIHLQAPLKYAGLHLADVPPMSVDGHTVDGEVQWNLPPLWEPLLLLVGGSVRASYVGSDDMLDAETYSDRSSPDYHKPGIEYLEGRFSTFFHGELSLADWVTVTFGLHLDYNTQTKEFLSPRISAVFRPFENQYLRTGVARSFRKPSFMETSAHLPVEFPAQSPITGTSRVQFQEFMTRILGNSSLDNEDLLSFEVGYLGNFLDEKLSIALDLFYTEHRGHLINDSNIVVDTQGLPDLRQSSFMYVNEDSVLRMAGSEFSVRYSPVDSVSLLASWTHRQTLGSSPRDTPKNLITLGGRFESRLGLIGSLYVFTRSEFIDPRVENPGGILEAPLVKHMDNIMLVLGKLGWRFGPGSGVELESGLKLFLPISPFSEPHFRYFEKGGGFTSSGQHYGGESLGRVITVYLQGSI